MTNNKKPLVRNANRVNDPKLANGIVAQPIVSETQLRRAETILIARMNRVAELVGQPPLTREDIATLGKYSYLETIGAVKSLVEQENKLALTPASTVGAKAGLFSMCDYEIVIAQRDVAHQLLVDVWQTLLRRQVLLDLGLMEYLSDKANATTFLSGVGYSVPNNGHSEQTKQPRIESRRVAVERRKNYRHALDAVARIDKYNSACDINQKHWFSKFPLSSTVTKAWWYATFLWEITRNRQTSKKESNT